MEGALLRLTCKGAQKLVNNFWEANNIDHPFNEEKKAARKDWVFSLLKSQKRILSFPKPDGLTILSRLSHSTSPATEHFDALQHITTEEKLKPSRIFNLDETGAQNIH
ncbi:hypothetical protein HPB48_004832 [Haemaphysalis longicornis]|uniref:Uncharacterized protein n=1 Tax=Haemaphysalis longicornis TaxID=44386 RepID=A0A9J6FY05_HAELO|nr:hypothetical protein HPB48_004832 [Haemaphysalis longicornis]